MQQTKIFPIQSENGFDVGHEGIFPGEQILIPELHVQHAPEEDELVINPPELEEDELLEEELEDELDEELDEGVAQLEGKALIENAFSTCFPFESVALTVKV